MVHHPHIDTVQDNCQIVDCNVADDVRNELLSSWDTVVSFSLPNMEECCSENDEEPTISSGTSNSS
eukprot:4235651-Ditylum_brightwellii.AAC.1